MGDMADYYLGLQEESSCIYGYGGAKTKVRDRRPHIFNEERYGGSPEFKPDENYYHLRFETLLLINGTRKAYLIKFNDETEVWIPKKICREVKINGNNVIENILIHGGILSKILDSKYEMEES